MRLEAGYIIHRLGNNRADERARLHAARVSDRRSSSISASNFRKDRATKERPNKYTHDSEAHVRKSSVTRRRDNSNANANIVSGTESRASAN